MNYYEHHIGDYLKNTAHLSMLEDGAYRRLIDSYCTRESPLPADRKAVHRLARAQSKPEKDAVDAVLDEFFTLEGDGWHQSRCDKEIAKFTAKMPAAEEKKENDKERQRRARERRKQLFEELASHGVNMSFNATTEQLIIELSRVTSRDESQTVTQHVTRDNTCTHSPLPTPHSPVLKPIGPSSVTGAPEAGPPATSENATRGELCKKLRAMSVDAAPHLQAWSELTAFSDDEILAVAEIAKAKKPNERIHLNYLVPILKDRATVKPTAKRDPPWWGSEASILAKGRELGIDPRPGELMPEFKSRIQSRLQAMEDAA